MGSWRLRCNRLSPRIKFRHLGRANILCAIDRKAWSWRAVQACEQKHKAAEETIDVEGGGRDSGTDGRVSRLSLCVDMAL